MRIIFAGTPEFAAIALQAMLDAEFEIIAVYTQPDRRSGRGQHMHASPVKQLALKHQIPVEQPINFKDPASVEKLATYQADLMVVAAYGLLLPESVLNTPTQGCINIHGSLLPHWRGAAPIHRAIQAGDGETGITIMQMDKGLDTGDMLYHQALPIEANETGGTLHDKLAELGGKCIVHALKHFHELKPEKQNDELASYAKKLSKHEAQIDWHQSAENIERCIRAFNPWPICYSVIDNTTIRIFSARVCNESFSAEPGTIIEIAKDHIRVACGENALDIFMMQLPGSRPLSTNDILNSKRALFEDAQFK